MKRNLLLVPVAFALALSSCSKVSELDPTIVSSSDSQTAIEFSTYASSATATKGSAVSSNSDFQTTHGSFAVAALVNDADFDITYDNTTNLISSYTATPTAGSAEYYFGFGEVNYTDDQWINANSMYWPNYSKILHFAAYAPASVNIKDGEYTFTQKIVSTTLNCRYEFSFPYTVTDEVGDQVDLMYAITSVDYLTQTGKHKSDSEGNAVDDSYVTTGVAYTNTEESVNLHFKHALTQIAFTATKDSDIDVYVKSVTICNVYNNGTFTATAVTDDDDADIDTNPTVGEEATSESTEDLVDASNFGTWATSFDEDGWGDLTDLKAVPNDAETLTCYYVEAGSGGHESMSNYEATLADFGDISPEGSKANSIKVGDSATSLTSSTDVLMLMPQTLTAWIPNTSIEPNCIGYVKAGETELTTIFNDVESSSTAGNSLSYLAIDCEIYHEGATSSSAKIHSGYIFVPFSTEGISYSSASVDNTAKDADEWLAGYKITYCLNFGGGYVADEDNHDTIPEPGCIPDTETLTLRTVQYTITADSWIDVAEDKELMDFENGVDEDTSYN